MKVTLIDSMGTDLTVVNSARVSFDKESYWEETCWNCDFKQPKSYNDHCAGCGKDNHPRTLGDGYQLSNKDAKLIQYLASHNHTSPFRHCFATFRVKAPIFVARQLVKHQVGMSWNEVSRRYVDSEPEFYWPTSWRARAEDKKQGSGDDFFNQRLAQETASVGIRENIIKYNYLLDMGVAPEQARMILPQNMYTEWYWSGSLQAWAHVCNLRCKPDAQEETRQIALQLDEACAKLWPVSWKALRGS